MTKDLTIDEFNALEEISKSSKHAKASPCVGRNTKKLSGLKYISIARDGSLSVTEKGQQALFSKYCITGLRAIASGEDGTLDSAVAIFLARKSYIAERANGAGFDITERGRECLADIDAQQ